MSVLETIRSLVGVIAIPSAAAAQLGPQADEVAIARARRAVTEAEAQIAAHLAERVRLVSELEEACELERRARNQLQLVAPALDRAREAREADKADRRARIEGGTPGADPALAHALEEALHEVREARRAESAAREVLPGLETRTRTAQEAVKSCDERIDESVWRKRIAEFAIEAPAVRTAAAIVSDYTRRLAAVSDVAVRWKGYGTPHGAVPDEFLRACATAQTFTEEELRPFIRTEREYLIRLRSDPKAKLDD